MELFTATGKLRNCVRPTVGTDNCSSEEYRCTQVDACVARTSISCHPWCTHRKSLVVKKTFSFPMAVKNSIDIGHLVFLL
jgi:hypothetical protein